MAEIRRTVQCPLPGLETVAVTYNLMATQEEVNAVWETLGSDEEKRSHLVIEVVGWPGGEFGHDPFGPKAPMAFQAWACNRPGYLAAMREFIFDPNSSTALKASMPA